MIRQIFNITALLFLTTYQLFSQTIESIEIKGTVSFSSSEYINWTGISEGVKIYKGILDSAKTRIGTELTQRGYYNFLFEEEGIEFIDDSQKVNLTITINEGSPTYLNKIFFNNISTVDSLNIISQFQYIQEAIFYESDVEDAISEIINIYEENGHPFISIKIESVYFFTDSASSKHYADLHLNINKGKTSTIDKVEITGNDKTKDYVIVRNIRLNEKEEYSQERINDIPKKLNRLRFFEPVNTPSFYFNSKNEGILQINIKEKNTNNFDGIIGYIPENTEGEKGYFTGFVNISLRNLFGTGRAAAIRWQQEDRYSQELELKYLEPWLFGIPFNINLGLFQRKQDTTYIQRNLNGNVEYLATEDISASFIISSETVIPTENETEQFTVYNSSTFSTGLNLSINNTDDYYAPTEGIIFINTYKFSSKKINGPADYITEETLTDIKLQRLEVDFAFFYELFNRQVISFGIHGRELRGPFFELSDLYRLGGTFTLRGYREKQFAGNRVGWTNFEYRYLLTRRSYAYLFFDSGYFLRSAEPDRGIEELEDLLFGYGLGINLETGIGVLGFNLAFPQGGSFSEAKIHFGILNEF